MLESCQAVLHYVDSAVPMEATNPSSRSMRAWRPNQINRGGGSMRRLFLTFLIVGSVALGLSIARAQEEKPDGTVRLSSGSVAVGIGFSWGSGELTYQGKEYPFDVSGLSVADVGISKAEASGSVHHLKKLEDFNGNYTGVSAGATVAGGGGGMTLRNQNGVVLNLVATTQGLKFKLAVDGVKITLKQ